jgi:hypothetical protein
MQFQNENSEKLDIDARDKLFRLLYEVYVRFWYYIVAPIRCMFASAFLMDYSIDPDKFHSKAVGCVLARTL